MTSLAEALAALERVRKVLKFHSTAVGYKYRDRRCYQWHECSILSDLRAALGDN